MKNSAIVVKATNAVRKYGYKLEKHSPEILLAVGVVGTVASAVMACKATLKVNDILDESKELVDKVHSVIDDEEKAKELGYSEQDSKKDLAIIYGKTGVKLVKLYAPSVILGALSIGCTFTSHNIMRKRNIALGAAYATLDQGYKQYRSRVVERFGENVDRELKYDIKAQKVTETVVDEETGKEKKVKTIKNYINPDEPSVYARYFGEYTRNINGEPIENLHWHNSPEYNMMFLNQIQRHANDLLRARGHIFLNEVYDMLGLPRCKEGAVVGWVYNTENPVGDNFVDFGIFASSQNYDDYIYGNDPAILLDFNVDGVIYDLI